MEKDLNKIAKLEKAIREKYGDLATKNPRSCWSEEEEQEYQRQLKGQSKKVRKMETSEAEGFSIEKRLIKKDQRRICPVCEEFSFEIRDDLYMAKFDCCYNCYIQYVEDREERWRNGWRPNVS